MRSKKPSPVSLDDLVRLDALSQNLFGVEPDDDWIGYSGSLSEIGLGVSNKPQMPGGYWCSPTNSLCFGGTGGDGVHFSFLTTSEPRVEDRPVLITLPANCGINRVVGENLYDFLCAGCLCGYDILRGVADRCFFDPTKWGSIHQRLDDMIRGESAGDPEEQKWLRFAECQGKLLDFLTNELSLSPWKEPRAHFDDLQSRYASLIEVPEAAR